MSGGARRDTQKVGRDFLSREPPLSRERRTIDMNVNDIATLVSSVGFPIVMCGAIAWYVKYQSDQHKSELNALADVIAENTKVIEGLKQLIQDKIVK